MFLSRLEQASRETQRSTKILHSPPPKSTTATPSKTPQSTHSSHHHQTPQSSRKSKDIILHELNDYLFDLFDANMMEDFHTISKFEEKAMQYFEDKVQREIKEREAKEEAYRLKLEKGDLHNRCHRLEGASMIVDQHTAEAKEQERVRDEGHVTVIDYKAAITGSEFKEFSHEEFHLHREFLTLFEGLIEKFLASHSYTSEEVYDELYRYAQEKRDKEKEAKKKREGKEDDDIDRKEREYEYSVDNIEQAMQRMKDNSSRQGLDHEFGVDYNEYESHPELYSTTDALEVLDVLAFYTDFPLWSSMMKENAKYRLQFRRLASVQQGKANGNSNSASSADSK